MNATQITALLTLTHVSSENLVNATTAFMTGKMSLAQSARAYSVKESNISRLKAKLLRVHTIVKELKAISPHGEFSPEYIQILVRLTKIKRPTTLQATIEHICHNVTSPWVAKKYQVETAHVLKLKSRLIKTNNLIIPIFDLIN